MPSTLAQTATILAVGRKPSGESRAFSALDRAACAATATKVDGIEPALPVPPPSQFAPLVAVLDDKAYTSA